MGLFFNNNDFVGIEIGNTAIRLVQLRLVGKKYTLISFGSAQLPPKIVQSDSKLDMQKVAAIIQQLVKSSKVTTKNVATALPASAVFSFIAKMPPMSHAELENAIRYQAEQNIPLKIEDVRIDWQVIRENPTTHETAVMVVSAPNKNASRLLEIFNMADMNVIFLETNSIANSRSLSNLNDPIVMIVDIGAATTEITIVENSVVSHVRSVSSGGYAFTRAISQGLGLDITQAEQFKQKFGMSQDKLEGQVYKTLKPFVGNITDEIRRSMKYYYEQFGTSVQKIVLTGGSSRMLLLAENIKNTLNVEVTFGNPWINVKAQPEVVAKLNDIAPEFATVVGLAMRDNK
ncbi:MAG: type IV pilus assembly protein PilM [bacterium]